MKILELRFKNLNSLYGEWLIDFTNPEYQSNGIFALTGPTGAGKSTILDAICLALYGATPRLGKITKSGNEIMSRQTGDCYSEVIFESKNGQFICHWEHRRSRKKADGALQIPEHQIAEARSGKLIESKKSRVAAVIEEKTGMDFDRFTRSILLAQGGFDTFLKADVEQKSKILEQITGTEIYSEISRRVHQRQRDEREKLNLLQARSAGIAILEPEHEKQFQLELEDCLRLETEFNRQTGTTAKAIDWLNGIDGLKKDICVLKTDSDNLNKDREAFMAQHERLNRALKAAELDAVYAPLTLLRKQQTNDLAALKTDAAKLPELENVFKLNAEALKCAEQQTRTVKEDLKRTAPLILKVRSLDQQLAEQKKAIEAAEEVCKTDTASLESDKRLLHQTQKKHNDAIRSLAPVENYLKEQAQDEWLVGGLTGIEAQWANLLIQQKEVTQKTEDKRKAETGLQQSIKKLDECIHPCERQKQVLQTASKTLEQENNVLNAFLDGRLLREYRTEKDTLMREMAFHTRITELEAHRSQLEDGKPCPLCGALEHPYAIGNIPLPEETEKKIQFLSERIKTVENQEAVIRKLELTEHEARQNLAESEQQKTAAANAKQTAEKQLIETERQLNTLNITFLDQKRALHQSLTQLGYDLDADNPQSTISQLQTKQSKWLDQTRKKADMEKQIASLDSEVKRLSAVIKTKGEVLTGKQAELEKTRAEYQTGYSLRKKLFGTQKTDTEHERLNQAVSTAELAEKQARMAHDQALQKLNATRNQVTSLEERLQNRSLELQHLETEFTTQLLSAGFKTENLFLEACLSVEERNQLATHAKALHDREAELKTKRLDRESRLQIELEKKITDKTIQILEPQLKAYENKLKQLRETVASLKHRLVENANAKEQIKEQQAVIEMQKQECLRWEKLHSLIGSADGKKFRNFAQGLTFERMVSHANRQLEKMSDRYLLIRDDDQPLELNVVDNYQAGEIRSTRNLSGGESFIVSLTLALGLSKMASRKVRVDSLFLDEGFGTLDEDALETALETLSGLQQNGKLIGIISHVSSLKDRISTQITIAPVSGGKSILSGPGCSKVNG